MKGVAHGVAILVLFLVSACMSLPKTQTIKIDGLNVEYATAGHGVPTVIFENGFGSTLDDWNKVIPEIAKGASTFAYNRPGNGSTERSRTARDGEHIVNELRKTLQRLGYRPPYILVGHSLGGLYMQYYARRYPDEVGGLILVDSSHPTGFDGEGSWESRSLWDRMTMQIFANASQLDEMKDAPITGQGVLSFPPFKGKPVIVLCALLPYEAKSQRAEFLNSKRHDLARLYPGSKQIWVESGHFIALDRPDAVIAAIREVLSDSASTITSTHQ